MMRGPTYDDAYISRKMSSMHGPTFAPPGGYGRPPMGGYMQEPYGYDYAPRGYPMGPPPPRMVPRMAPAYPSYYDYDYGYGGGYGYPSHGYGYGYAPPPPRMSRYESYMDDDVLEPTYGSRYRSRVPETLEEMDIRDKITTTSSTIPTTTTTTLRDTPSYLRGKSPSGMLQDHVDKMRIRLKSIAFSLDPSGPVPDIIVPERPKKGVDGDKKYTQALEFNELPKLASRRQRYYPEDDYIKDNLRIKCLSHYKTTRTAADASMPHFVASESTSRYDKLAGAKWEEPDTVFGTQTDKKPYSKPLTDGTSEDTDDKKERRRKKKSKERDVSDALAIESGALSSTTPAAPSDLSTSEADKEVDKEASIGDDEGLDEKERKKLEKKKRKAEREAAAKAAMEAELAALAAAEAELARLEAESSSLKTDSPAEVSAPAETPAPAAPAEETPSAPAPAPAEPATEVKSESAADKSGEPSKAVRKLQSATNKIMAVGAFLRTHVTQKKSSGTEVDDAAAAGGEEEQQSATAAFDTTDIDTTFGGGHDEGLQDTITLPAETGGEALFDDSTDAAAAAAAAAATSALPSSANRSEEDLLE